MNRNEWQKVKKIFDAALELAPNRRKLFLDKSCGNDDGLRREVEKLLDSFADDSFMEQPAAKEVASAIIKAETKNLEAGKCFGHYEIVRQIGAGGMGDVYLAKDTRLNRQIAIKFLSNELNKNENHLQRFVQEARAASALNHPNIITVYEIGEFEDTHFIAAEYIEGETLRERLSSDELSLSKILDIATQTANALSAAHKAGIIHRDIKPENVMIRREDNLVKVLDFGLAKLTGQQAITDEDATLAQVKTNPGMIMGTVAYMSPEQARGRQVDERTDIWSFGAVLYEMLAERQPFAGETLSDAIAAILKNEPAPLGENTPPELNRIIRKTLQKNVDERYQTVKDLLLDLKKLKREVEFSEEIERSHTPSFAKSANVAATQPSENATAIQPAVSTQNSISPQTSSAEYVIGEFKKHKFVSLGVLAALIVVFAAIGYFRFFAMHSEAINSIAVLPFVNESGNADVEYLSDGMTESLINSLSQLPKLSVKARSSVFRYKGKATEAKQVGADLNVQAVLTGRVIQRGDDLTLYLSLDDVQTGNQIWGKQYNRKITNLVALQAEIARDVSINLKTKLSGVDEQKLTKKYTENVEAYQEYLKGRYYSAKSTEDGLKKSVEHFQRAIEFDPNYAPAYAGLANAYWYVSDLQFSPRDVMPKAKAAAIRALEIDESLAEAHAGLGIFKTAYDWDWVGAEKEFRRAIELNADDAATHQFYGWYLALMGRHDESFAEMKRAQQLDPLSININSNFGRTLYWARRYDDALGQLRKSLELDPNFWLTRTYLSEVYLETGNYTEALSEIQKARQIDENHYVLGRLGLVYARMGRRADALMVISELKELSKRSYVSAHSIAVIYVGLGEKDAAFEWLEKAFAERAESVGWSKVDPRLDSLRADPRFQDLLQRVGLPQ